MYQYDDPTAAVSLPASTAAGTAGYFSDGSPGGGQPATVLRAEFMNMLMMEILNAVTGAGLTPSKSAHTQLRDAIAAYISQRVATTTAAGTVELATNAEMATGASTSLVPPVSAVMSLFSKRSFSAADYIRFPDVDGGMIVQWGNITSSSAVSFPIAFPKAVVLAIGHLHSNTAGPHGANQWYVTTTLSQITLPTYLIAAKYLAIGY